MTRFGSALLVRVGAACLMLALATVIMVNLYGHGDGAWSVRAMFPHSEAANYTATHTSRHHDSGRLRPQNGVQRENATIVTLCRNKDLASLLQTIQSYEDRFNHKFHYDWVFLNDEEFSEDFITYTSQLVSGEAKYGKIPEEMWGYPDWIDQEKARKARETMASKGILYGGSESYRHMCRFQSGFFYHHPLMQEYKYYWRVDADTRVFCDIDYDVFKFMREEKKRYGFIIALHEYTDTIPTLWSSTIEYLKQDPSRIHKNALSEFISPDYGKSFNLCHFWSNFEIADADFWRGELYSRYFDHLDRKGGMFYERWGDAPIHTIAASLFLDRDEIHHFDDIGYYHEPFYRVPENFLERNIRCSLTPKATTEFYCLNHYKNLRNPAFGHRHSA